MAKLNLLLLLVLIVCALGLVTSQHKARKLFTDLEREQARAIWKAQLDSNPDNAVLKETVRRLAP